ncbi:MAG: alkaline phosphatase family protein [Opitutia bacterium]
MKRDDWDLTCVYFRAIDEISHMFMPYHPPRMEGLKEEDFAIYKDVVNSTYRLHDLMLTRLVDLAGPEAGVLLVSDHGFHSDHLRPRFVPKIPAGIIAWHRSHGIVAAAGKGFRAGVTVEGARLPDLTPTILGWFGLPRSEEMMGRRLDEILDAGEPPADIPSWDAGPILAEPPRRPAHGRLGAPEDAPALRRPRLPRGAPLRGRGRGARHPRAEPGPARGPAGQRGAP